MNAPVRNLGRIGEQHTAYRRGLVLGLTMAEVGILIIFVLLLLIALGALERQRSAAERQGKELLPSERVQELETAEASLLAVARALNLRENAAPEEVQELVRVVLEATRSVQGQTDLQAAREALEAIRRTREEIQRVAERVNSGSGEDVANMLEAQSRALANKEGQLQYAERRLETLGEGNGARPCWVEPDGSTVWLYDVILTTAGIRLRQRDGVPQRPRFADLPIVAIDPATVLTESEFLSLTRPLYDYGQRDENQCRFHVWVYDGTEVSDKELYKRLLRTVEGHFYKQYTVGNGIPF